MAEYIEREALLKHACTGMTRVSDTEWQKGYWGGVDDMAEYIREQPAADVVEVRPGEWRKTQAYPHWLCCSECDKRFIPNEEWIRAYDIPTNYCPNCGAKMDGKGESK